MSCYDIAGDIQTINIIFGSAGEKDNNNSSGNSETHAMTSYSVIIASTETARSVAALLTKWSSRWITYCLTHLNFGISKAFQTPCGMHEIPDLLFQKKTLCGNNVNWSGLWLNTYVFSHWYPYESVCVFVWTDKDKTAMQRTQRTESGGETI